VERTVDWHRQVQEGQASILVCCLTDLAAFEQACGGYGRESRRQALADLQALSIAAGTPVFDPSPEELISQDRAR
jgi:hypothetical protein